MGAFLVYVAIMNQHIRPLYLTLGGFAGMFVGWALTASVGGALSATSEVGGLVTILGLIVFLSGIAGAITGAVKRRRGAKDV